jgi:hypothetical protein
MQRSIRVPGLLGAGLLTLFAHVTCAEHFHIQAHDPVMIQQDGTYHVFCTANPNLKYDQLYSKRILALDRQTQNGAVEAPFIFSKKGYYYLFVSWDRCCRGVNSTYKIMAGRSKKVTGPHLDQTGQRMDWSGGTLVVKGVPESKKWAALATTAPTPSMASTTLSSTRMTRPTMDCDIDGWPSVTLDE